jgi:hypothetical protein
MIDSDALEFAIEFFHETLAAELPSNITIVEHFPVVLIVILASGAHH